MNNFKIFCFFLCVILHKILALQYRSSWDNLFESNSRVQFKSDEELQIAIAHNNNKIRLENSNKRFPFVFQYVSELNVFCHDSFIAEFTTNPSIHYQILNSNHGLIYASISDTDLIHKSYESSILDYNFILPQLKISSDLNTKLHSLQKHISSSSTISLYLHLFPMNSAEMSTFKSQILVFSSIYNYNVPSVELDDLDIYSNNNVIAVTVQAIDMLSTILEFLSERNDVKWIEEKLPFFPALKYAIGVSQSDTAMQNVINVNNLTGVNHVIGIADTGIDAYSCYFYDPEHEYPYDKINLEHRKIISYKTSNGDKDDSYGHGTIVSGTAAGKCDDTTDVDKSAYNGAAYNAKIAFVDIGSGTCSNDDDAKCALTPPTNCLRDLYVPLYQKGAVIQSMSWGSASNKYTTDARYVDQFMYDYPDALVLFAAGNSGTEGNNTVLSPSTNKNGLSVGATLNDILSWQELEISSADDDLFDFGVSVTLTKFSLADFSSRGPTHDGRVKPDICSIGWYIQAASHSYPSSGEDICTTANDRGTSFATPLLAGHAVLVREYFLSGFYETGMYRPSEGFSPSGALIKAVLVHSGTAIKYITDDAPSSIFSDGKLGDNNGGYGRSILSNGLSFNVNATTEGLTYFVRGSSDTTSDMYVALKKTGDYHTYYFKTVDDDDLKPIKITMAYTDYYGSAGSSGELINDLDIVLYNSTNYFYPVVTHEDGKYDRKNTVEVIVCEYPKKNSYYYVRVNASSIIKSPQSYAIVMTGDNGILPIEETTDWTLVIFVTILMMCIISCLSIACLCVIMKKRANRNAKLGPTDGSLHPAV